MATDTPFNPVKFVSLALGLSVLGLASAYALSHVNFLGTIDTDAFEYCESTHTHWLHQPVNALTNLAFFWTSAAILVGFPGTVPGRHTPMHKSTLQRMGLSLAAASIGFGSLWFHANLRTWSGFTDNFAMNLFATQMLVYGWERTFRWSLKRSALTLLTVNVAMDTLVVTHDIGKYLFGFVIALTIITEVSIVSRFSLLSLLGQLLGKPVRHFARSPWLLLATIGVFIPGALVWQHSRTGAPWCSPESWFQGHAVWHVCCAMAVFVNFLYFRSEAPTIAPSLVGLRGRLRPAARGLEGLVTASAK